MSSSPSPASFLFEHPFPGDRRLVANGTGFEYTHSTDSATRSVAMSEAVPLERKVKRSMDVVGAGLALIVLSPLMVLIAIAIKLTSKGPALFCQPRMGFKGREFVCLKFRTMVPDAESKLADLESLNEAGSGAVFKMKRDPRVTRFGWLLRRTSLDELPQLWNILRGDMSTVGPRPLPLRDSKLLLEQDGDAYRRRLSVPQGLTGLWQVSGRSELDGDTMVRLDAEYVEKWSLWLDMSIILRTFSAMIGRGAC